MARLLWLVTLATLGCAGATNVGSIGAVLGVDNETGATFIREVPEGMAADTAGIQPGDELIMIDGVYTRDLGAQALRQKLRGEIGSIVRLTVVRGDRVLHLTLRREALRPAAPHPPAEERVQM